MTEEKPVVVVVAAAAVSVVAGTKKKRWNEVGAVAVVGDATVMLRTTTEGRWQAWAEGQSQDVGF